MILVKQIDGVWQRWVGLAPLQKYLTKADLHYHDGRVVEIDTDPYQVADMLDPGKVAQLVGEGVWGEAELAPYGLKIAEPFTVPEGKVVVGAPRYVETKGKVYEACEVEDAPPAPPEPTKDELLAALLGEHGLSVADLKEALAK